jgi:hypothetical protein
MPGGGLYVEDEDADEVVVVAFFWEVFCLFPLLRWRSLR